MLKSVWLLPLLVGAWLGARSPGQAPAPLDAHVRAMQGAQMLRASLTVIETTGITSQWQISFAKPNKVRVARGGDEVVLDGRTHFHYTKKDNQYTEAPQDPGAAVAAMAAEELWAWRAFFDAQAMAKVSGAKKVKNRVIKGIEVVEYQLTFGSDPTRAVSVYLDPKTSLCRGFSLKTSTRDFIAIATNLELSDQTDDKEFAFAAPPGAVRVEAKTADVTYAKVQAIFSRACMPCHSAQMHSGGLDLTSYEALMSRRGVVVKGDPAASLLVRSLKLNNPSRMPKGRPPLPDAEIALIENWVKSGAPSN
jgi:outer membrane lipoprotein-sorting protein